MYCKKSGKSGRSWAEIRGKIVWLLLSPLLTPLQVSAASITAQVIDDAGQPLEDAVISLTPSDGAIFSRNPATLVADMDQWDKQFAPFVLPIQVGTQVKFPNRDNIKHHVYSFSAAKRFELKLYSSGTAPPMLFDKAGIVALGCNIHDWMLGYIDVLETPYFAKSNDKGLATIADIPNGKYQVEIWHPRLNGNAADLNQTVELKGSQSSAIKFALSLKRDTRQSPPRYFEGEGY